MIIVIILFFYSCAFASQRLADRPSNPNPNPNNKQGVQQLAPSSYSPYYNPSQRGPIFVNPNEGWKERYERITGRKTIFGGDDDDDSNNNPHARMKLSRDRNVFVVAKILLYNTNNTESLTDILQERHKDRPFFSYTGKEFRWKKNNQTKLNFASETLQDAIIQAHNQGYNASDFVMLDKNLWVIPHHKLYTTQIPAISIDQVSEEKLFTLLIVTPDINEHIELALMVALSNSRLRDMSEGLYAIISRFNPVEAHKLSKEDQTGSTFLNKLLEISLKYCTPKNMPEINRLLKAPGDEDYLSKLQNFQGLPEPGTPPIPGLTPLFHFTYAGALKFILQLYAVWSTSKLLKQMWTTKKIPSIPIGFLQKTRSFAILLGTGLLIKDLFNGVHQFIIKKKDRK